MVELTEEADVKDIEPKTKFEPKVEVTQVPQTVRTLIDTQSSVHDKST